MENGLASIYTFYFATQPLFAYFAVSTVENANIDNN
jgi:hypothetical protein